MTIKTLLWWTFSGTFSTMFANKFRGYHLLRKPQMHVIGTAVGLAIGYKLHLFEENYEEYLMQSKKELPLATIPVRENLIAYQTMLRRKQESNLISSQENFEISEEEEEED